MKDERVRRILMDEMERQGVARHAMSVKTKLPLSTLYQVFNPKKRVRLALETVSGILAVLGKNFAWLESATKGGDKPAADAKPPKKAPVNKPAAKAKKTKPRKQTGLKQGAKR